MPVIPGVRTIQQRPIYDRVIIAAAATTTNPIQFFTVPIGQGTGINGAKQLWDTNMNQAQTLPFGKDYLVRGIRFWFQWNTTANDAGRLFENYVGVFIVGDKTYWEGPLWLLPSGGGLVNYGQLSTAALTITTSSMSWMNGFPDARSINVLDLPIRIANGENFRFELQGNPITLDAAAGTTFGQGLNMRLVLDGEITEFAQ
jgi:hypothetical protein